MQDLERAALLQQEVQLIHAPAEERHASIAKISCEIEKTSDEFINQDSSELCDCGFWMIKQRGVEGTVTLSEVLTNSSLDEVTTAFFQATCRLY